jgi:hypothetical protein
MRFVGTRFLSIALFTALSESRVKTAASVGVNRAFDSAGTIFSNHLLFIIFQCLTKHRQKDPTEVASLRRESSNQLLETLENGMITSSAKSPARQQPPPCYVGDGAISPVGFQGVSGFSFRRKIFVLYV